MNSLIVNINQAISDFNNIKQAIINKGVEVPNGTPTNKYGELIGNILSGSSIGNNILPHSEGLTYYFDYQKNISDTGWTDTVQGHKINQGMLYNSEYAALQEGTILDWNIQNAFTVYCIFKSINYSGYPIDIWGIKDNLDANQLMIINWGNNQLGFRGKANDYRNTNSSSFNYNILALAFFEGMICFYINGEKVDTRSTALNNFDFHSWYISGTSNENKKEVYFKMLAFYENVAQTSDIILENTQYIAQKYGIEI